MGNGNCGDKPAMPTLPPRNWLKKVAMKPIQCPWRIPLGGGGLLDSHGDRINGLSISPTYNMFLFVGVITHLMLLTFDATFQLWHPTNRKGFNCRRRSSLVRRSSMWCWRISERVGEAQHRCYEKRLVEGCSLKEWDDGTLQKKDGWMNDRMTVWGVWGSKWRQFWGVWILRVCWFCCWVDLFPVFSMN